MINAYLARQLGRDSRSLVLDAPDLGTSTSIPGKVVVFGKDKDLPEACRRFGIQCLPGWSGDALRAARGSFSLIYLDYCGSVKGNGHFSPICDIERASGMLRKGGILAVTFCKRHSEKLYSRVTDMTSLPLRRTLEYKESAAMSLFLFSERTLPRVGPALHSIVRVGNKLGRVRQVLLDGVTLVRVRKRGAEWKTGEEWDVPFSNIQAMRLREPALRLHRRGPPKKRRKRLKKQRVFHPGEQVQVRRQGVLWDAEVFKDAGLDRKGVVLKFHLTPPLYEVFLDTSEIRKV